MNESYANHTEEVLCRFLELTVYASTFIEPSDESFDDVS